VKNKCRRNKRSEGP